MNKAFLFDMDGVLVNSEQMWHKHGQKFLTDLFGKYILSQLGSLTGLSIDHEYELATSYGFAMDKNEFYRKYDEQAMLIYSKSKITEDIDLLLRTLKEKGYKLGLVSSSRKVWIDQVLPRIFSRELFDYTLSLNERKDLRPKPHPDGYYEAIKILNASPKTTIVLEDSNSGIKAAKAVGAFTIAFTQHLIPNYVQIDADAKAKDISEILEIVNRLSRN